MSQGLDTLKVKFTHSNTVRKKKPYTIYEIEVRSTTNKWVIYKRYSDFHTLHQELSKQHASRALIRLPHLPPKRLTRSLAAEFVEKRKNELQKYQRDMLQIKELMHSPVLLKFLEVPDSVRGLIRAPSQNQSSLGPDASSWFPRDEMNKNRSYEERKVYELTNLLEFHPNRVAAIKSFEKYYFENRPRLSNEYIRQLFQGKSGGTGEGGLVHTCGDFAYSHVASRAALYLLCRLLDVEKNKNANLYVDQFINLSTDILAKMQLHLHILSERGNRLGAFQIVSLLRQSNSRNGKIVVEQIVTDTWALREYYRWAERKIGHVISPKESQETELTSLAITNGHAGVVKQMFEDILKIANNEDQREWRIVTHLDPRKMDTEGVSIRYKKDSYKKDVSKDMVTLKVTAIMPFSAEQVSSLLMDFDSQQKWDPKFHHGKVITKLDSQSNVVHMTCKSFSSPYKFRDFCLLRTHTKSQKGEYLIGIRSILHSSVPESKSCIRAVLSPAGYVITPIEHHEAQQSTDRLNQKREEQKTGPPYALTNKLSGLTQSKKLSLPKERSVSRKKISLPVAKAYCRLIYTAQMDKESVLIVSPDLLGETNELVETIANIKSSLSLKYPKACPPPQISQDVTDQKRRFTACIDTRRVTAADVSVREGVAPPKRPAKPRNISKAVDPRLSDIMPSFDKQKSCPM